MTPRTPKPTDPAATAEDPTAAAVAATLEETPATNVIEAIRRVMRDLPGIAKDTESPNVPYKFRGIEAITAQTQRLMARHGVVLAPFVSQWDIIDRQAGNPPKPWTDDRVLVLYRVYGPGGRDDFIEIQVPAIGRDNSDKGSNKAMTQAYKYAMLQLFNIGDATSDADADRHETSNLPSDVAPQERENLTIPRDWATAYIAKAEKSGLTLEQIQAITYGVTNHRTSLPSNVLESEWDELNAKTKTAVDVRRAGNAPKPAAEAPTTPVEPTEPAEGPKSPEPAPDAPTAPAAPVSRETETPTERVWTKEQRDGGQAIIAEAQRCDMSVVRTYLMAKHISAGGANDATLRAKYARLRSIEELDGYDPLAPGA